MAESKTYTVLHKKSNVLVNGKPRLPEADVLEYGEIAINYAKGGETISLKNSSGEVVTFQNEVLIANGEPTSPGTYKILIDESMPGEDVDIYTKEQINSTFATKEELKGVDVTEQLKGYAKTTDVEETYLKKSDAAVDTVNKTVSIQGNTLDIKAYVEDEIKKVDVASQLTDYPDSAEYVSGSKEIQFKHNGSVLTAMTIDATAFIKDGMVSNVEVKDGNLEITFNEDGGNETIKVAISDIFNASNYYTKEDVYTKAEVDNAINPLKKQTQIGNETTVEQGYLLVDETIQDAEVEIYTKAEIDSQVTRIDGDIEKKVVYSTGSENSGCTIMIDESVNDGEDKEIYTKAEVDALFAKLKQMNPTLNWN